MRSQRKKDTLKRTKYITLYIVKRNQIKRKHIIIKLKIQIQNTDKITKEKE